MTFEELEKVFSTELSGIFQIKIEFSITGDPVHAQCSMGKIPHNNGYLYWCRVNNDEIPAYTFCDFESLSRFCIANFQSLRELWDQIEIRSIDGFSPRERLPVYLNDHR